MWVLIYVFHIWRMPDELKWMSRLYRISSWDHMSRIYRRFGDVLGIPKSVIRASRCTDHEHPKVPQKIINSMTYDRYGQYLDEYNCFVLLRWREPESGFADKNGLWNQLCERVHGVYRDLASPKRAAIATAPSPVFFKEPINVPVLNSVLESNLCVKSRYFCSFQQLSSPETAAALEQYLRFSGTSSSGAVFEPAMVGIDLASVNSGVISNIQPLLQESSDMYRDLNYEKLLQIAKRSTTTDSDPLKMQVKKLLVTLAESKLSKPRLSKRHQWLLFT